MRCGVEGFEGEETREGCGLGVRDMQSLIATLVIVFVICFGSKKVLDITRMTRMSLHSWNMKRKGEKEAEKMAREREQDVYTWQATCAAAAAQGAAGAPNAGPAPWNRVRPDRREGGRSQRSADAEAGSLVVYFDEDEEPAEAVAASVVEVETV